MGKKCVYCKKEADCLERDHVPPKALFTPPLPANLITVPACSACHRDTSKDDMYFRSVLAWRWDVYDRSDMKKEQGPFQKTMRSLTYPEAKGFRKQLLTGVRELPEWYRVLHPGDVGGSYEVDLNRVSTVVRRIARGLFFHETCGVLSPETEIRTACSEEPPGATNWQAVESFVQALRQKEPKVLGDNVFSYRVHFTEIPELSAWLFSFYGVIEFFAGTWPKERDEALNS